MKAQFETAAVFFLLEQYVQIPMSALRVLLPAGDRHMGLHLLTVATVTGSARASSVRARCRHGAKLSTGSSWKNQSWDLHSECAGNVWLRLVPSQRRSLTSGSAALLSAPSADAWPPRSSCWPAPSGAPASSPPPSSRSKWDRRTTTEWPAHAAASRR